MKKSVDKGKCRCYNRFCWRGKRLKKEAEAKLKKACKINTLSKLNLDNWTMKQPWNFQKTAKAEKFQRTCERSHTLKTVRKNKCDSKTKSQCLSGQTNLIWEFDPGSGWTLAACLTHASRTEFICGSFRMEGYKLSGGRVSNAWVTCLIQGDNS